jgi:hypothetical protein
MSSGRCTLAHATMHLLPWTMKVHLSPKWILVY